MHSHPSHELIDAYLAGELQGQEAERVRTYLDGRPGRRGFIAGMRAAGQARDRAPGPESLDVAVKALLAILDQEPARTVVAERSSMKLLACREKPFRRYLRRVGILKHAVLVSGVAAACVMAIIVGFNILAKPSLAEPESSHIVSTRRGQQVSTTLPDGTRVTLAPATTMVFTMSPSGGRTVTLDGQAYFSVVHDEARPFAVRTRMQTTRVLGTAFVVRSYATDDVEQIAVTEGKVAVDADDVSTILLPGDVGRVSPGDVPHITRDAKTGDVFGWMRGEVVFDNATLEDVAVELERLYDLEITFVTPSLAQRKVTMTIAGESAQTLLDVIAVAVDAQFERQGRTVRFHVDQAGQ